MRGQSPDTDRVRSGPGPASIGRLRLQDDGSFKTRFFDPFFGDFRFKGTLGDTTGSGTIE